jgi:hypothetical protein
MGAQKRSKPKRGKPLTLVQRADLADIAMNATAWAMQRHTVGFLDTEDGFGTASGTLITIGEHSLLQQRPIACPATQTADFGF